MSENIKTVITVVIIISLYCLGIVGYYFLIKVDYDDLKKSVVQITVYKNADIAIGSGVVAFENDIIITNAHVLKNNHSIEIFDENNVKYEVEGILAYNNKIDIAILKLKD